MNLTTTRKKLGLVKSLSPDFGVYNCDEECPTEQPLFWANNISILRQVFPNTMFNHCVKLPQIHISEFRQRRLRGRGKWNGCVQLSSPLHCPRMRTCFFPQSYCIFGCIIHLFLSFFVSMHSHRIQLVSWAFLSSFVYLLFSLFCSSVCLFFHIRRSSWPAPSKNVPVILTSSWRCAGIWRLMASISYVARPWN